MDLIDNKYKNINLNSIMSASVTLGKNKLDNVFNNLYYNLMVEQNTPSPSQSANIFPNSTLKNMDAPDFGKIYEIIFNSIKYKNMGGIRLEIKGRLTKRYRADRALFKVK
jgi:hypothetical protein